MRIVVTGANGRLGRIVVAQLLEQGMEVVGLDRELIHQSGASISNPSANML